MNAKNRKIVIIQFDLDITLTRYLMIIEVSMESNFSSSRPKVFYSYEGFTSHEEKRNSARFDLNGLLFPEIYSSLNRESGLA